MGVPSTKTWETPCNLLRKWEMLNCSFQMEVLQASKSWHHRNNIKQPAKTKSTTTTVPDNWLSATDLMKYCNWKSWSKTMKKYKWIPNINNHFVGFKLWVMLQMLQLNHSFWDCLPLVKQKMGPEKEESFRKFSCSGSMWGSVTWDQHLWSPSGF